VYLAHEKRGFQLLPILWRTLRPYLCGLLLGLTVALRYSIKTVLFRCLFLPHSFSFLYFQYCVPQICLVCGNRFLNLQIASHFCKFPRFKTTRNSPSSLFNLTSWRAMVCTSAPWPTNYLPLFAKPAHSPTPPPSQQKPVRPPHPHAPPSHPTNPTPPPHRRLHLSPPIE